VDIITHKVKKPKTNPVIKQNPRSIEKEKTIIRMYYCIMGNETFVKNQSVRVTYII